MPLISIIIPTLNSGQTLAAALDSIIAQRFNDYEVIIMDGASSDNTLTIAKSYNDKRIKVFSERDKGIYDAMNKAISLSEGDFLYFLGSDDALFNNNVLGSLYPKFSNKQLHVIYGNVLAAQRGKIYDGRFNAYKLSLKNICHQSIFFRKSVFDLLGLFDLRYHVVADWHFNMKWYNHPKVTHLYVDQIIAFFNPGGYCQNNIDHGFIKDHKLLISQFFPFLPRIFFKFRNVPGIGRLVNSIRKTKYCITKSQAEVSSGTHVIQPK